MLDKTSKVKQIKDKTDIKYQSYKIRSIKKKQEFNISLDYFLELLNGFCVYCKTPKANTIDRIDSSLGYIPGNCQSCCSICNTMKWNLSEKEFLNHIKRIYQNT